MVIKIVQSQFNLWPKEVKRVFETIIMDHRSSQIATELAENIWNNFYISS